MNNVVGRMSNYVRYLNGQPHYEQIFEQDGFTYVPMKVIKIMGQLPIVLSLDLWRCHDKTCSGRVKRFGRFLIIKTPHDACILSQAATPGAQANDKKIQNHVAKPGPKRVKPNTICHLSSIPENKIVVHPHGYDKNERKLKAKNIILIKTGPKNGVQLFLVSYYGIRDPSFVPVYFAQKEWPQRVKEFKARVARYGPVTEPRRV